MKFGFVSAGGGDWYSRTLAALPDGARVFACVPKLGYVGVGNVTAPAAQADEITLEQDGAPVPFSSLPLAATYKHSNGEPEFVVPVAWIKTRPLSEAIWQKGMFANQNSACKLRSRFTLERLVAAFGVEP
jgi:hypothetical protein